QVNLLAMRTESKTVADPGSRVEVSFREHEITAGGNGLVIGNAILDGHSSVIRQEPTAHVYRAGRGIVEFNVIDRRRVGMSQHFIDDHPRDGGSGINGAWGAAGVGAGPPINGIIGIRVAVWIATDQRESIAIGGDGPFAAI